MKRRAAEIAAIKLCNSSYDNKPTSARSRDSRSSPADKTQDKKDQNLSGDKVHDKKERSSSTDKTQEKKEDVTTRGRQAVKRRSADSEDGVDSNRRSSLRSSHPETPSDSRSAAKKPDVRKKSDTRNSVSSSETDTDSNATTDTEDKPPVKQRKIGNASDKRVPSGEVAARSLKSRQKEPHGRDLRKGKIHYSSVDDDEDDVSADQRVQKSRRDKQQASNDRSADEGDTTDGESNQKTQQQGRVTDRARAPASANDKAVFADDDNLRKVPDDKTKKPVRRNRELELLGVVQHPVTDSRRRCTVKKPDDEKSKILPASNARPSEDHKSSMSETDVDESLTSETDCDGSSASEDISDDNETEDVMSDSDSEVIIVSEVEGKNSGDDGSKSVEKKSGSGSKSGARSSAGGSVPSKLSSKQVASQSRSSALPDGKQASSASMSWWVHKVNVLEKTMAEMKAKFAEGLRQKDTEINKFRAVTTDEIERLKNQLKWQEEQMDELNKTAERNTELEARIGFMLSSRQAYEEEVAKAEENSDDEDDSDDADADKDASVDEDKEAAKDSKSKKRKRRGKGRKKKDDGPNEAEDIERLFVGYEQPTESPSDTEPEITAVLPPMPPPVPLTRYLPVPGLLKPHDTQPSDMDSALAKGRHEIRRLRTQLEERTKLAGMMEADRRERIKKLHEKHQVLIETDEATNQPVCRRLVLEFADEEKKDAVVEVNKKLVQQLKPHQAEAVEFMWDNVIESLQQLKEDDGSASRGCILAHCMGLGKTLSVIALIHTLVKCPAISMKHCLVLAPLNAVLNWVYEWHKWLDKRSQLKVYELASRSQSSDRNEVLAEWRKTGGVLVMGYQLFRILVSYSGKSRKTKQLYESSLINPGADIIVCDEGHVLKNDASALSKCVNNVRTRRRIVLTGTPLQNNLIEYHCMVSFVKLNLLGTRKEFCNRFVNPITNGQHLDSTPADVRLMKRRAHVLHGMLTGCVQRRDYSALVKFLPPKHEYVVSVRLSSLQISLYQQYLDNFTSASSLTSDGPGSKFQCAGLFSDYHSLMHIWTHPYVLRLDEIRQEKKPLTVDDDDELESILFTSSSEDEDDSGEADDDEDDDDDGDDGDDVICTDDSPGKSTRSKTQVEKQVNGLQNHTDSETDKTVSEADNDVGKTTIHDDAGKTTAQLSNKTADDKNTDSDDDNSDSDESDEVVPVVEPRPAKVIAGEVIKHWQTKTRSKGGVESSADDVAARHHVDQWWNKLLKEEDRTCLEHSGKLVLLFDILTLAQQLGDKVLVFSQSLLSLDLIEEFLALKTEEAAQQNTNDLESRLSVWKKDEDYVRMDGSTGAMSRKRFTANFNDATNERLRLFLISTKAGGLGINLDTANRVVIFDASWNPSHDIQSIFRVYRFGQQKPVFVYRLLAQGTMEEKIYDRQVTKETLSQRVVDEHQIDRHFTAADLRELYVFNPDRLDDPTAPKRPIPSVPKDVILAELLSAVLSSRWIINYHEHDSLLENRPEENLSEDERKAAWEEYEREKLGVYFDSLVPPGNFPHSTSYTQSLVAPRVAAGSQISVRRVVPYVPPPRRNVTIAPMKTRITMDPEFGDEPVSTVLSSDELQMAMRIATERIPEHLRERFKFHIQQLPKVVQEILKYNPVISLHNLEKRLTAFLGMHTRLNMDGNDMLLPLSSARSVASSSSLASLS